MRTPPKYEEPDDADLQAPPELVSALKNLPQERLFVPPAVDEAVARAARERLGGLKSGTAKLGRPFSFREWLSLNVSWKVWLGASATVVVLALGAYQFFSPGRGRTFGVGNPFAGSKPVSEPVQAPLPSSASTDRRVDILDAFMLARQLKAGPVHEPRWDINHDGVVDERDVRAIAIEVVRLDKGGRS
jgi:hypothetical protein